MKKKIRFALSQKWCWGFLVVFLLLAVIPFFLVTYLQKPPNVSITLDRSFWDDRPWEPPAHEPMTLPIQRIIMTYTGDQSLSCTTPDECIERLRIMLEQYIVLYGDIPFNFIIGDDGYVYEGRGFTQQGLIVRDDYLPHTDNSGLVIAFFGDYGSEPSEKQKEALETFLAQSVNRGMMEDDFTVLCQASINMEPADDEFTNFLNSTFENQYFERKLIFNWSALKLSDNFFFEANHVFKRSAWLDNASVISFDFETAESFTYKITEIVFEYIDEIECSNLASGTEFLIFPEKIIIFLSGNVQPT